jgi:nicotinamide-nucleotide amidase
MKAEIIATGTEILLGEIVDTNTSFLASELALLGIDIHFTSAVGDNYERFSGVLRQAWERSDIIITTGGLGPTQGDITRDVIARVVGEETYIDEGTKRNLVAYFSRLGTEMPANNLKQATLIPSAVALMNPQGTAPGWWVEKHGRIIIALPGPPGELQPMWRNQILPRLRERSGAVIVSRILKTWGFTESKVDEMVAPYLRSQNPTVAIYARPDGIILRITAKSINEDSAREMITVTEANIRRVLGERVWGVDQETMASVVGRLLADKGLTLAVCESFTGGFLTYSLSNAITNSPCFTGGIVVTSNVSRIALGLGSEPFTNNTGRMTAAAMASIARSKLNTHIGIGLDGDINSAVEVR